jgi:hypothetical protein
MRNFKLNPELEKLMINYYGITHEASANEEELIIEYWWLCRENKLHLLFDCETMTNEFKRGRGESELRSPYSRLYTSSQKLF